MIRRVHVPRVRPGAIPLDARQARHARDVLRLEPGTVVEVFDDAGAVATGELVMTGREVSVRVEAGTAGAGPGAEPSPRFAWTVAAAVPKGERADWMVEKLSELGTAEFIPLAAARSVVLPEGKNKRDRWARIATESAKQSRRAGVMRIGELTSVENLLASLAPMAGVVGWYFSTAEDARALAELAAGAAGIGSVIALIGPEGGWTESELAAFVRAGLTPARLTDTVLRVETAAIAAAAVIGSVVAPHRRGFRPRDGD